MGAVLTKMTNDFIAEFTLMNNQVYPYTPDAVKTCVSVYVTNNVAQSFTVDSSVTIKFDDGLGTVYPYVFTPVLPNGPVVIPAATVIPGPTPQDPPEIIPVSVSLFFETSYVGTVTVTTSDHGGVYQNDVLVTSLGVQNMGSIDGENEMLYYFTCRMTEIIAENIKSANFIDHDRGDENPGYGPMVINFNTIKSAIDYGFTNMLQMQEHPSTSNLPITATLSRVRGGGSGPFYLDKIVGDFFYYAVNDYTYIYQLEYDGKDADALCDELNALSSQGPPYVTADQATIMGAQMMAGLIDSYCNDAL